MENSLVFPKYFSIQTTSLCNADCFFCPNKEVKYLFPPKIMDEKLYKKIIDECKVHKNIERIILYLNNEPLTDCHIINRINYAKETVPWASVHILTNGSLLDDKMQDELINSKLDWIGISMHGIKKESVEGAMGLDYNVVFPRLLRFIQKAKSKRNLEDFIMVTFLNHKYLSPGEKDEAINFWKGQGIRRISYFESPISRAGNINLFPPIHLSRISGCNSIWANEMIHIVENGDVVMCCMDWKREVVLGNLENQDIYGVWNSPKYALARNKRDGIENSESNFICKRCEEAIILKDEFSIQPKPAVQIDGVHAEADSSGIVLVMVPPWQTKMPPLGLAYLSSFLRASGVKTRVIDFNVKLFNKADENKKYFWDIATINNFTTVRLGELFCVAFNKEIGDFVNEIVNSKEKLVGLSTTIASLNVAVYIAHQIKQRDPSKTIILGGPGVFWSTQIIDPHRIIDIFVIGEGELPLLGIASRFKKNKTLSELTGIPGTIICFDKKHHSCTTPNPVKDVDKIPLVDFLEFDLSEYNVDNECRPLPILISRGCINHCSFCIDHKMIAPFRTKNPQKVFDELKYYIQKFGVHDFEFNDLLCNGNLKQLEGICDLIIKEKLALRWHSYAAIRPGMTIELLRKMRDSGCLSLCYGMESASDIVLKKMNKTFDSHIAERVIQDTHNARILTKINIIIGHPGESEKEFKRTWEFIIKNKDFIDEITNVSTCFLMPETDLIKNLDKFGIYFKKTFKDHLRVFLKGSVESCNYRQFYVLPDNSPRSRAKRLRKMISLITKLGISYIIVNRVKEDDANFDKLFRVRKLKKVTSVCNNLLKINFDPSIKVLHVYFKDQRLTSDVGMNASFSINDKWTDSSTGDWEVDFGDKWISVNVLFKNLPISQEWLISLHKESLSWKVKTHFHKDIVIAQQKLGIVFSDHYNKYMINRLLFDFPPIEKEWKEVDLLKATQIALISGRDLPNINLCQSRFTSKIGFIQLQNLPFSFCSRMVNFLFFDPVISGEEIKKLQFIKKGNITVSGLKLILNHA